MKNTDLNFIEKTAFNYNSSFQDKKKIAELNKEIESLKAELEKLKTDFANDNEQVKVISTAEDFSQLICERLLLNDKIKLVTALNQDIKKQQSTVKNQDDSLDKTGYIAKRIFKTRPAKKAALINTIKTMFQDGIEESEIEEIILDLQKRGFIKAIENKIIYLSMII
jgi:hypothetical protein